MMPEQNVPVSVIIPTLQEEKYIAATLQMLKKAKPSAEIIVVDGGSCDKTVEIARHFTDKVYQARESGISKGKNLGAKHAVGSILVFMDADVTFPSNFVERILKTFEDTAVVGATCNIMPSQHRFGPTAFFRFYNTLIRASAKLKPHSRGEFFAVRKEAFKSVKGFNENLSCMEDHDLARRLSKLGKFVFIKDLTVYESLRRFQKLGFIRVMGTWLMDYVSVMLRGKPFSKVWQPIR